MLQNSSDHVDTAPVRRRSWRGIVASSIVYALWVGIAFIGAQLLLLLLLNLLAFINVPLQGLNSATLQLVITAAAYVLAMILTLSIPRYVRKDLTSRIELGLHRWPKFSDIGLAVLAFIPYALLSFAMVWLVKLLYAGFDEGQSQEVGFQNISSNLEYVMAFIALVVVAPVAEEIMFRGYLYGKLRARTGVIIAIIVTSLTFAVLHMQLNVGIDVFALSIVLCILRETTGSIWAGTLLHMLKNGIAFYFLFISPILM